MTQWYLHLLCIRVVSIFFLKNTQTWCAYLSTHLFKKFMNNEIDMTKTPIHLKQPQLLQRSIQQNRSLTGGGFFRRLNTLVSPRLREAMVGWGPKDASLSLCQAMLSFPSRYRLHSNELKVRDISRSIVWRRFRRMGCHYGTKQGWLGMCTKREIENMRDFFPPTIQIMVF